MSDPLKTPGWIDSLIDRMAPPDFAEEIRGDLLELFEVDRERLGVKSARRRYLLNALGFLAKRFFWKRSTEPSNHSLMLRSYFKMASRSLMAFKGTAAINILGLVVGIAASLVVLTVLRFEMGFDRFHSQSDRTYRVVRVSGSDMSEFRTGVSYPVHNAIRSELPIVKTVAAIQYEGGVNIDLVDATGATKSMYREDRGVALAEPSFFQIFDFKNSGFHWLEGDPRTALVEPFTIVLTKTLAKKYFGNEPALGKPVRLEKRFDCKITGVIDDLPPNTDFPFTMLVSYSTLSRLDPEAGENWSSVNDSHQVFVVLTPSATEEEVEAQLEKMHATHTPKDLHQSRHYLLQSLKEIHTDARFGNFNGRTISPETLWALGIIGIFLLLTACINYVNLATAQSTLRAKEIGLRKVMGSNRGNLLLQFLTETFVIVFLAGVLALGLSELLLLRFQSLLNLTLTGYNFLDVFVLGTVLAIVAIISVLAGFYPALILSRFSPVAALKARFGSEKVGGFRVRKILVVAQFTITQILVVGTFIVVSQMNFFRNTDMGFTQESILTARVGDNQPQKLARLQYQLAALPFVERTTFSYTLPSGLNRNRSYRDIAKASANDGKDFKIYEYEAIDSNYLAVFNIRLLAGRNLTINDTVGNVLINKKLMQNLGWTQPEEALGQELKDHAQRYTIVGIISDFYSNSLKEDVDNIVMSYKPEALWTASVKLADTNENLAERLAAIETIWKESFPDHLFRYQFFEENVDAFYRQEQKYADLFQLFSLTFLLIGCLGLYGLITFVVNRKGKEIAIRKVLGAGIHQILFLFSREYLYLILISFLLAVPIAYYAVNDWLSNFAHRIELSWWRFTLPGLVVLAIALLVVGSKSWRSAQRNPIEKLKEE